MKNKLTILLFFVLFSCKNNRAETNNNFLNWINCEKTGDLKFYLANVSDDYKSLLFNKYKTTDDRTLIDSVTNNDFQLIEIIKEGKMACENQILEEVKTTLPNISLIKYRMKLNDIEFDSKMFQERIVIKEYKSESEKYTPYDKNFRQQIDSLLVTKYNSPNLVSEISNLLEFKPYNSKEKQFTIIKKKFEGYVNAIKSNDENFLDYIYSPAFDLLVKESNGQLSHKEIQKYLLENLILSKRKQELNFKNYYIDNFNKINCTKKKELFILDYVIDVENNVYIPGKALVVFENNKVSFLEYNKTEYEGMYQTLFDAEIMQCIIVAMEKK